jgi:glycosyltransferase involved in cell wall biosynthesis
LAAGLFPIVSDIPANREWITDGENGLLFPAGDDEALARCMERAMKGGHWIDAAILTNKRQVHERANAEVNLHTLSEVIASACSGHQRRRV